LRAVEFFADGLKGGGVRVVTVDVTHQGAELVKSNGIDATVFFEAVASAGAKLIDVPTRFGNADHWDVEVAALHQGLQRGENHLVGKVASGAEEDQGVRMRFAHLSSCGLGAHGYLPAAFSR
jgi:hypothetical protein